MLSSNLPSGPSMFRESAMKKLLGASLVIPCLAGWLLHGGTVRAAAIPDKNLEAAIRAVLHEPKAELTDEKLANVYDLEADRKDIRDLTGLEKCKNLALLKLAHNQVADLKPLKDLGNLQSLDLSNNKIGDLAPIAGLTKLQYL